LQRIRFEPGKGATGDAIVVLNAPLAEVSILMNDRRLYVLVMAHPDDESMFFLPTVVSLLDTGAEVWVLCLTTGNYDGLGDLRSQELSRACRDVIGMQKVILLDEPAFPDHPTRAWPIQETAESIHTALRKAIEEEPDKKWKSIDLLTFDQRGVSNHANHRDTFFAVRHFYDLQRTIIPEGSHALPLVRAVWTLDTVENPFTKYIPVLEWLLLILFWCGIKIDSLLSTPAVLDSDDSDSSNVVRVYRMHQPALNWRAMAAHTSQFVWYRRLFVVFSCYTYHNRLQKLQTTAKDA
jgi:N-acetylglucosaminylphosphatidylinositol deacetylase